MSEPAAHPPYRTWQCADCGYIYAEEDGDHQEDLPPGTRWEDLPDDWECPLCGAPKASFLEIEV
ncbi:rubredoxin [Novosphingobium bradum]|uniref:Rubredoxin n=1 Tax=Novosphingobium bradum TaxID=1737444 RepID=A0ABV7IJ52_9SPHN